MRKALLFVALCACVAFAVNGTTRHKTFNSTGTIAERQVTDVALNAMQDTVNAGTGRLADTLNIAVPRWTTLLKGDSLVKRLNVDSIRSYPNIDSIKANPLYVKGSTVVDTLIGDTAQISKINVTSLTGYNIKGVALTTLDTTYSAKGIKAALFDGTLKGNVTGTADSAKGAHHLAGGSVQATTISSTRDSTNLQVVKDSLKLENIVANNAAGRARIYGSLLVNSSNLTFDPSQDTGLVLYSGGSGQTLIYPARLSGGILYTLTPSIELNAKTKKMSITTDTLSSSGAIKLTSVVGYADSASAYAGGVRAGGVYRVGGNLRIMY